MLILVFKAENLSIAVAKIDTFIEKGIKIDKAKPPVLLDADTSEYVITGDTTDVSVETLKDLGIETFSNPPIAHFGNPQL